MKYTSMQSLYQNLISTAFSHLLVMHPLVWHTRSHIHAPRGGKGRDGLVCQTMHRPTHPTPSPSCPTPPYSSPDFYILTYSYLIPTTTLYFHTFTSSPLLHLHTLTLILSSHLISTSSPLLHLHTLILNLSSHLISNPSPLFHLHTLILNLSSHLISNPSPLFHLTPSPSFYLHTSSPTHPLSFTYTPSPSFYFLTLCS